MTTVAEHHGQHDRCRACGTNDRARGTNPRGLRPPDPPPEQEPPNPSATLQTWDGPERDPADGELVDDIDGARQHIARARRRLDDATKPPMGPAPISTRGAVK